MFYIKIILSRLVQINTHVQWERGFGVSNASNANNYTYELN